MKRFMSLLFVACVLAACGQAQGALVSGFNTDSLAANDDGSTDFVSFGFTGPINFFGASYTGAYLNNNGNLTFTSPQWAYTPFGLTGPLGQAIIAPFFADVDTRGGSSDLMRYGSGVFDGRPAFGVTWDGVNGVGYYYYGVDKLNKFQVLLVDRSDVNAGDFDIVYNYDQIQWETGDASDGSDGLGGTSATAGFSNGSGDPGTNFQLDGSLVNGALIDGGPNALVSHSFDSDTPGSYVYEVRNGTPTVITPECSSLIVWSLLGSCGISFGCWRRKRHANEIR